MAGLREQRVCMKLCFKLGTTAAETHQMFKQAFGDNSLGQTQTQTVLNTLTRKNFQDAFQKWQKRWERCVLSQGDYFQGDCEE
jgi:hypothetical protein